MPDFSGAEESDSVMEQCTIRTRLFQCYRPLAWLANGTRLERLTGFKSLHRWIMSYLTPESVDFDGHKLFLDSTDAMRLSFSQAMPFTLQFLKTVLKPGDAVVDVGAHIGLYTVTLARAVGAEGHVFAFEPDPLNLTLLRKNTQVNSYRNVTIVPQAVSDAPGKTSLFLSNCSALHRTHPSKLCDRAITVDTVDLDGYFKEMDRPIRLIKLDIEGAEPLALRGMSSLLDANPDVALLVEFVPAWLEEAGFSPMHLLNPLLQRGYAFHDINDKKQCVEAVTLEQLMVEYPPNERRGTNLWCVKPAT
ncbi:MAG: FkbM family methyltransferase [Phycisphaerales bacterium]|nr:FkbM family methyltransferase [Phycisphaerales bacterium]